MTATPSLAVTSFSAQQVVRQTKPGSHQLLGTTGGRTSTGKAQAMRSGVGPPDSQLAGLATDVVNSKRSTQRRETRCVAKDAGASAGSENMKCVSTRSAVISMCSPHTCIGNQLLSQQNLPLSSKRMAFLQCLFGGTITGVHR